MFKVKNKAIPSLFGEKFISINKNTLTGPASCKKTTRHHTHLWLCANSRKISDAKSRNHSNWRSYLVLTSGQKRKKSLEPFLKKISKVWFWFNLETFSRICPNQEFYSKILLFDFSTFIVPFLHVKNQKNPQSRFWENCVTNQSTPQPIITRNTDFIGPG